MIYFVRSLVVKQLLVCTCQEDERLINSESAVTCFVPPWGGGDLMSDGYSRRYLPPLSGRAEMISGSWTMSGFPRPINNYGG